MLSLCPKRGHRQSLDHLSLMPHSASNHTCPLAGIPLLERLVAGKSQLEEFARC